ncbi:MAG: RNA-binding protein [Bacteroidales bacterium]|nr:RNA-binding protein [Bacteroidales bacterium]
MNIYVGNLDFKVNESDLQEVFEEYGDVSSAKIVMDKYTGRSKGFGFVTMENDVEANKAISELNGANYENRDMVVNEAKPRTTESRPPRSNEYNKRRY